MLASKIRHSKKHRENGGYDSPRPRRRLITKEELDLYSEMVIKSFRIMNPDKFFNKS